MMDVLKAGAERLGLTLSQKQIEKFDIYRLELLEWNRRINLTGITDNNNIETKHFLDALTVYRAWPSIVLGKSLRIIDIGSGGGIPGIPLKIILPEIHLALLEATKKKASFLRYIADRLAMSDIEVISKRAECAAREGQYRERFQIVVSRAVASLVTLAELSLPFCMIGGRLIAQKKGKIANEIDRAEIAIERLGGRLRDVVEINLAGLSDERKLVVIDKEAETPLIYPRRTGIPAKRPLT
jgi:16S rRNA (guanine527-N7)-methyltransferase